MTPFLDSRHLRLVAEIARAESVTRAADRLHVTQSAVSHQLRDIETRLGTPLFVRSGRRMLPTAAGKHMVEAAARVLADIARAEAAVRSWRAATAVSSASVPSATPATTGCRRCSKPCGEVSRLRRPDRGRTHHEPG